MPVGLPDFFHDWFTIKSTTYPDYNEVVVNPGEWEIAYFLDGMGEILQGFLFIDAHGYFNDDWIQIWIDDVYYDTWRLYDIYYYNIREPDIYPFYSKYYNTTAHKALFGINGGIRFRKYFEIDYYNESSDKKRDLYLYLLISLVGA